MQLVPVDIHLSVFERSHVYLENWLWEAEEIHIAKILWSLWPWDLLIRITIPYTFIFQGVFPQAAVQSGFRLREVNCKVKQQIVVQNKGMVAIPGGWNEHYQKEEKNTPHTNMTRLVKENNVFWQICFTGLKDDKVLVKFSSGLEAKILILCEFVQ